MTSDVMTPAETKASEHYFGGCPECGSNDGYLDTGRTRWCVCDNHKTKWCVGANLFSGRSNSQIWQQNFEKLEGYREVRSMHTWKAPRPYQPPPPRPQQPSAPCPCGAAETRKLDGHWHTATIAKADEAAGMIHFAANSLAVLVDNMPEEPHLSHGVTIDSIDGHDIVLRVAREIPF